MFTLESSPQARDRVRERRWALASAVAVGLSLAGAALAIHHLAQSGPAPAAAVDGGIIGATLAFFWRVRRLKLPVAATLDCLTPALALGQAVGRLGCFSAGCCYGTACGLPWAVTFTDPTARSFSGTPLDLPLHPVQLYTFLANLLVMALLLGFRRRRRFAGQISACYFILEGAGRILTEHWRGDLDRGFLLGVPWLSTGRLTSAMFIVFGCSLLAWFSRARRAEVVS